ncbi:hypothetical protein HR060_11270 [Catenovulum sp. SM1970]|uniref:hypothetical protein n=1 Tax=Marinifaba aquimaris TaxID=2741323 RepID=UPI001572CC9F|nr:hypothetical protein [Marinifaba aquimaris]NTS77441.1 hypothetical protein [Marinifaba aquimaris]
MLYDISTQTASLTWGWLLAIPTVVFIYYWLSHKTIVSQTRSQTVGLRVFCCFGILFSLVNYLSLEDNNAELKDNKKSYIQGEYETIKGVLYLDKNEKGGLDKFKIDKSSFIRILPHKNILKKGCWAEFIKYIDDIDNKYVRMDFINFPKSVYPPFEMGNNKVDQICILRFEIID